MTADLPPEEALRLRALPVKRTQVRVEYERRYRQANRQKLNAYMRSRREEYRLKNPLPIIVRDAAEIAARDKASKSAWYQANKEKHRENDAKWRLKNKEKVAAYVKEYATKNMGIVKKAQTKYRKSHIAYYGAKTMERNARKLDATPAWANQFFIEEIYDLAQRRTKLKTGGIDKWHVDHIVPLQSKLVCGLHVEHNLQVIPSVENYSKGNRCWPDMP